MSDYYIQLPPDSTGKRSTAVLHVGLEYTGHSPQVIEAGNQITGATSGAFGTVVRVEPDGGDPTIGTIDIVMDVTSPAVVFTDTENLQINASTVAQANGIGVAFYTQKTAISGGNNPFNTASVDNQGALYVRNAEGSPQYDAFGLTRASSPTIMSEYVFPYGELESWQEVTTGAGAVTHLPNEAAMALDVSAASGDVCSLTTHLYHRYQPGMGQYINMTLVCGDTGKTNMYRRWGYYDDDDGCYFELDDSGDMYVCLRSSVTGSPVESRIVQADWNRDKADGSDGQENLSGITIDPTKLNIYWIDFGWLGAGKVRFGIFDNDGGRITLHMYENPNSSSTPWAKTGVLPIRVEIENTGIAASPSRVKLVCASVMTDGNLIPDRKRKSRKRNFIAPNVGSITTEVPIASFRSALVNGAIVNRKITLPEIFSFYVQDKPVIVRIRKNATTLTGASFALHADSSVEVDTSATVVSGGDVLLAYMLETMAQNFEAPPNFGIQGESMKLAADGTYGDVYTITAESLDTAAQVRAGFTWIDIE